MATTADGVGIHYETTGVGRDVVLIHGITDSIRAWGPVPELLSSHYRVTALDLRGHGESTDAPDYSSLVMATDVAAVVGAAGVTEPLVIGHSLGGVVATGYAASAPTRGVVNVDQPLHLAGFQGALQQVAPMLRNPVTFEDTYSMIVDSLDGEILSDEIKAEIRSQRRPRQEVVMGVWDFVIDAPTADLDELVRGMTSSITSPYLALMFVDAGPDYSAWLQERIPQAVIEQWPSELGHYGHRIYPERFVDTVKAFDVGD